MSDDPRLAAARYAMERVRFRFYAEQVIRGEIPEGALPLEMAEAMRNYDEIIEQAASGLYAERCAMEVTREHDYIAEFREAEDQIAYRMMERMGCDIPSGPDDD